MVMGHEKGFDTESRIKHNFGMARPEGYRKAIRLMDIADRFGLPIITLIDTAGAYPGVGAEERGQAEAIARSTDKCLSLGRAYGHRRHRRGRIGRRHRHCLRQPHPDARTSVYTVASPEAAASILWRDSARAEDAANNMKITAQHLLELGVIDSIIAEPVGGAHRDPEGAIKRTGDAIRKTLGEFDGMSPNEVRQQRHQRFLDIGRTL